MKTRRCVAWPNGGTPPIGKPVASRTASASTRAHLVPPAAVASFFSSSWLAPLTYAMTISPSTREHEALDDLADVDADGGRGVRRGLGALGESTAGRSVSSSALAASSTRTTLG